MVKLKSDSVRGGLARWLPFRIKRNVAGVEEQFNGQFLTDERMSDAGDEGRYRPGSIPIMPVYSGPSVIEYSFPDDHSFAETSLRDAYVGGIVKVVNKEMI